MTVLREILPTILFYIVLGILLSIPMHFWPMVMAPMYFGLGVGILIGIASEKERR